MSVSRIYAADTHTHSHTFAGKIASTPVSWQFTSAPYTHMCVWYIRGRAYNMYASVCVCVCIRVINVSKLYVQFRVRIKARRKRLEYFVPGFCSPANGRCDAAEAVPASVPSRPSNSACPSAHCPAAPTELRVCSRVSVCPYACVSTKRNAIVCRCFFFTISLLLVCRCVCSAFVLVSELLKFNHPLPRQQNRRSLPTQQRR